ncbi:HlyC/CorC family transporter [Acinetobacter wuhouensis]|uniref:Polyamine export protein n=1 Tax=Acinetobacter wuhouensis TaxID=1879050 RepID=A0A385C7L9_9GAMM|nr:MULTISPECIES: hemolysin family protein [Acinetobacter]AXQ23235.1 HlyC/CorC family transporter [Acinetobacter wuhouensis]AYO53418.1 HlyC/CorC family transporter [Acinetobacter wuhouensis]RZG47689.1 HlyC/CorC family transporter [Acinetobacter wuhouensis]RZG74293.1 HlyC/CorC family transporter [Acinetobacter wuhouensis]RZG77154.1 HlyC/CorC family transporter [Acinetobacter sp. WCHAc060025]
MSLFQNILIIAVLIVGAGFLSLTEIALAGARKVKLKILAESGDERAQKVLDLQQNSADFFAASQIGLNAVAILGGILGEGAFRPYFFEFVSRFYAGPWAETISFALSFTLVTSLFILFADLMPKRMAMIAPEKIAVSVINPIQIFIVVCKPLAWFINAVANLLFRLFKVNTTREDNITFDDISAVMDAGAQAGVLQKQEHHFIENVFELEERNVPSSMTTRENVVYFTLKESEDSIRQKLAEYPYSKFLVCNENIDQVIGYVDAKDILVRILNNQKINQLNESTIRNVLTIPDTLTLSELLDRFRSSKEKFAVVINEYALVVGVITLSDIMITVMGDWVTPMEEEQQIIKRDNNSWLIEGSTPIEDMMHALAIDEMPDADNYETLAGFMMYKLRKIPRPADTVIFGGYKFEVVDVDHFKIDQLLVTRLLEPSEAETPEEEAK